MVERQGHRLAAGLDAGLDGQDVPGAFEDNDLPVALAGDIDLGVRGPDHRAGDAPAGLTAAGGIDDAGAQVLFVDGAGSQVDQADRVVLEVGDQDAHAVRADGEAGAFGLGTDAEASLVTESEGAVGFES